MAGKASAKFMEHLYEKRDKLIELQVEARESGTVGLEEILISLIIGHKQMIQLYTKHHD